jgi:hypothetical protein
VHFEFFRKLAALLADAGEALTAAVAALMPDFNMWLAREKDVTDWVRKSDLTKQIAAADRELTRVLVGINTGVEFNFHSSAPAIRAAAERVYIMMKNYGHVASEAYDEKAADAQKLLEQFTGPYAQDMSYLALSSWPAQLRTALNAFNNLIRQREDKQMEKPPYSSDEVRKGMEGVYHPMMNVIESNAVAGTSPEFLAFINYLNPDIDRLNAEHHRALKDLSESDHTVVEPIQTQTYTEQPITPIPVVYYREDEKKPVKKLSLGKDFSVTYKNNVKVGMAECTIHGKGAYKGQVSVNFNIARTI